MPLSIRFLKNQAEFKPDILLSQGYVIIAVAGEGNVYGYLF